MGQRIETAGLVVNYAPDRTCSFRIISGSVTSESYYVFEADNGATKFTTTAQFNLGFFKFGQLIVKRKIKKQLKIDMLRLKTILENGNRQL